MSKLQGVWAFADVAILIGVPIGVGLLARRGRPLWKSYGMVVMPYLVYATWGGRMPYLTAYALTLTCLTVESLVGLHSLCEGAWREWTLNFVVWGLLPTVTLWLISTVRRRARR